MNAAHLTLRESLPVGLVHINTVRRHYIGTQHADLIEVLHRRHPVLLLTVIPLFFHFRGVNQNGRVIFPRQRRGILKRFLRTRINRMRRHCRVNQWIALPLSQEFLGIREHFNFTFVVGCGKIDKGLAQHTAHPGRFCFFGHGILEVIHVGESSNASANLFCRSQPRSPAHELFVDVLFLCRKNIFVEPVVERHIIVKPAEQGHRVRGCGR